MPLLIRRFWRAVLHSVQREVVRILVRTHSYDRSQVALAHTRLTAVEIFGIALEPTGCLTACVPIQSHGNFASVAIPNGKLHDSWEVS